MSQTELRGFQSTSELYRATAAGQRILMPTFMDRGVLHGQCGGPPWPLISVF
jgi:hypothetical protein